MARIPYTDPQAASPEVREALEALPQLNVFKMLAHADTAFIPYLRLGGALLAELELDPKLRELAILLVAKHTTAEYGWIQHVGIAKALDIADEQITAIQHGEIQALCLDLRAQTVLHFTHEVLGQPRPDDDAFTALKQLLPPRQIVELLLVIGTYQMLAHVMTTLDIDIDQAVGSTVIDEAQRLLEN
jgi:4-carboxymuconolactone decarboxylase